MTLLARRDRVLQIRVNGLRGRGNLGNVLLTARLPAWAYLVSCSGLPCKVAPNFVCASGASAILSGERQRHVEIAQRLGRVYERPGHNRAAHGTGLATGRQRADREIVVADKETTHDD